MQCHRAVWLLVVCAVALLGLLGDDVRHALVVPQVPLSTNATEAVAYVQQLNTPGAIQQGEWWADLPRMGDPPMHVVLIGDSTMRYQFLDLAYRLHFPGKTPPDALLYYNNGNWTEYFRTSTGTFGGSMTCDCSRTAPLRTVDLLTTIENRFYRHPTAPLFLTYLQLFGHAKLSSRIPLSDPSIASTAMPPVTDHKATRWHYFQEPLRTVLREHVSTMQPKPTHVVINAGLWHFSSLLANNEMERVLREGQRIAEHVVWRATSQPMPEHVAMQGRGTSQAWLSLRHKMQRLDLQMQSRLCSALSTVNSNSIKQAPVRSLGCHFFPLAGLDGTTSSSTSNSSAMIPASEFLDFVHLKTYWYGRWNARMWPFLRGL